MGEEFETTEFVKRKAAKNSNRFEAAEVLASLRTRATLHAV